jgi:hypothetical protein
MRVASARDIARVQTELQKKREREFLGELSLFRIDPMCRSALAWQASSTGLVVLQASGSPWELPGVSSVGQLSIAFSDGVLRQDACVGHADRRRRPFVQLCHHELDPRVAEPVLCKLQQSGNRSCPSVLAHPINALL